MSRSRHLLAFASLVLLGACPVGCPRGKPKTLYDGPLERVEIRKTGRCSFQVVGSMEGRPWWDPEWNGYYSFHIDGEPASDRWLTFDEASRTITIIEPTLCHDGVVGELYYQPIYHTEHPR